MTKPKEKWEIEKYAERIIGKLYCPPPISPKLLEQEKKKIIPIISQEVKEAYNKGLKEGFEDAIKNVP